MKIISIDPGYDRVGIAIIEKTGGVETLLHSSCVTTDSKMLLHERILAIGEKIGSFIEEYSPQILAIETLFMTTNQKTVMGVSEARGVIIYEGARRNLLIREYTPLQVKIAVTGYGRASKEDVHKMVCQIMKIPLEKKLDDEIDAIAVGLTAFAHENYVKVRDNNSRQ